MVREEVRSHEKRSDELGMRYLHEHYKNIHTNSSLRSSQLDKLQNYYINSYSSDTELGQWVEKRPITHIHEDLIFLHGGINPQIMDIDGGVPSASDLSDLNSAFASSSSTSYLSPFMKSLHGQIVYDLVTYRGNHKSCREVEFVAERLNVSKVSE